MPQQFFKKHIKEFIIFFVIVLIALSIRAILPKETGVIERDNQQSFLEQVPVQVATVEQLMLPYTINGRVQFGQPVQLISEVAGTLNASTISLTPGTQFSKGMLLYTIESDIHQLQLQQLVTEFEQLVSATLPFIRVDFKNSYRQWDAFYQRISLQDTLAPLPIPLSKREEKFIASKGINRLYLTIKQQETLTEKYVYYAPFDGRIVGVKSSHGSTVVPGMPLMQIAAINDVEIEVAVSTNQALDVQLNQMVDIKSNQQTNGSQLGQISRIDYTVDPYTQSYKIYIQPVTVSNFQAGDYVQVVLNSKSIIKGVRVPLYLIQPNNTIAIMENGTARYKSVQVIHMEKNEAIVQGLASNDYILLQPISSGSKVKGYTN